MPWWSADLDKQEKKEKGISFSSIYLPICSSEPSLGGEHLLLTVKEAASWVVISGVVTQ